MIRELIVPICERRKETNCLAPCILKVIAHTTGHNYRISVSTVEPANSNSQLFELVFNFNYYYYND